MTSQFILTVDSSCVVMTKVDTIHLGTLGDYMNNFPIRILTNDKLADQ